MGGERVRKPKEGKVDLERGNVVESCPCTSTSRGDAACADGNEMKGNGWPGEGCVGDMEDRVVSDSGLLLRLLLLELDEWC
jgi:hypothetical protein